MSDWLVLSQTVTAQGKPRVFTMDDGFGGGIEMCMIAAERVGSGGSDANTPRRVVAIEQTGAHARRSLKETIRRYDPLGEVVFTR